MPRKSLLETFDPGTVDVWPFNGETWRWRDAVGIKRSVHAYLHSHGYTVAPDPGWVDGELYGNAPSVRGAKSIFSR